MSKTAKLKLIICILAMFSLVTFAYGKKRNKKMITVGIKNFQNALDPRDAYLIHHFILIQCLMDTLVNLDESGNIAAELVKKWEISKNRLTYSFELNQNYKFQDGSPVTAKDVAFSISRHLWKGSNSIVEVYLEPIVGYGKLEEGQILSGIKVLSATKFSITLKRPSAAFLYVLSMPSFSILSEKALSKGKLIGSGRMTLSKSDKGTFLNTWDKYKGTKPVLDQIKLVEFSSPEDAIKGLNLGNLDMTIGTSIDSVEGLKNKDIIKSNFNTLTYSHLFFNTERNPLFKDIEFRKDLTVYLQLIGKKVANSTQFLDFQPTYFPEGILPKSYYESSMSAFSEAKFAEKWKSKIDKNKLTFAFGGPIYPNSMFAEFNKSIKESKLNIDVVKMTSQDYGRRLKEKDYDVITGIYMGNFPDPDGFVEPIFQGRDFSFGVMPIQKDLEKLQEINKLSDSYKRLEEYEALFKKIEQKYYFAPMFKDKIPLLYNKDLQITKSTYRYESELWKIFWRE